MRAIVGAAAALVLASGCYKLVGGGRPDPERNCLDTCEASIADGCFAADFDCAEVCASATEDYELTREDAELAGCAGEFDAIYRCATGVSSCALFDVCQDELDDYSVCVTDTRTCFDDSDCEPGEFCGFDGVCI
jgi:hypothetical protein